MSPLYAERIVATPGVLFGKPRVKGTRIPVHQIVQCIAEGWSEKKIVEQFPGIKKEDIKACIAYAGDLLEGIHMIDQRE